MIRQSVKKNLATGLALVFGAVLATSAVAQGVFTTYAMEKNGCVAARGNGSLITWSPTKVTGPLFSCSLSGQTPVGTGLLGYSSTCTIGIQENVQGTLVFGMATRPGEDHFTITLPNGGSGDMYPCTSVEGLTGTN